MYNEIDEEIRKEKLKCERINYAKYKMAHDVYEGQQRYYDKQYRRLFPTKPGLKSLSS